MSWCSLSRMALVSHGNVCRALLVFLLCSVGAVFDLDSKFDLEGKSFAEPSFDEMDPSRGWCFFDVPSEPHVGPSLGDWFSTPDVTPPLHERDLPFAGDETDCGVLFKSASDIFGVRDFGSCNGSSPLRCWIGDILQSFDGFRRVLGCPHVCCDRCRVLLRRDMVVDCPRGA